MQKQFTATFSLLIFPEALPHLPGASEAQSHNYSLRQSVTTFSIWIRYTLKVHFLTSIKNSRLRRSLSNHLERSIEIIIKMKISSHDNLYISQYEPGKFKKTRLESPTKPLSSRTKLLKLRRNVKIGSFHKHF